MKIALIDPSLFTAPYDLALMDGIAQAEPAMAMRLYTRELAPDEPESEYFVEHFYRRWPARLGTGRLVKGLQHLFDMAGLCRDLERWQPDIIHVQWSALPPIDFLFLPRLRRVAPTILTLHDSNPHNGSPRSRVQVLGSQALLRGFDAIIVHTAQARARLEAAGIGAGNITRIPHGLLHACPASRRGDRSRPVELILFGKLKPYKGADVLIRAFARLPAALQAQCRLRVVGQPYMDTAPLVTLAAELGIASRVSFEFHRLPDDQIADLFSGNAVAVFPYREIDTSGVLMTAIAAGCPIVASRLGGFAEMLTDGSNALLFPPGDDEALTDALGRIVSTPDLRQKLAEGIKRLREATPSWEAIGRSTVALYRAAVGLRIEKGTRAILPHLEQR